MNKKKDFTEIDYELSVAFLSISAWSKDLTDKQLDVLIRRAGSIIRTINLEKHKREEMSGIGADKFRYASLLLELLEREMGIIPYNKDNEYKGESLADEIDTIMHKNLESK